MQTLSGEGGKKKKTKQHWRYSSTSFNKIYQIQPWGSSRNQMNPDIAPDRSVSQVGLAVSIPVFALLQQMNSRSELHNTAILILCLSFTFKILTSPSGLKLNDDFISKKPISLSHLFLGTSPSCSLASSLWSSSCCGLPASSKLVILAWFQFLSQITTFLVSWNCLGPNHHIWLKTFSDVSPSNIICKLRL